MATIDTAPLIPGRDFGARVTGLEFEQLADPEVAAELNALFERAGMVVFADVEPSARMHVALSNVFGPMKDHPSAAVPRVDQDGMPGVIDMVAAPEEGAGIEVGGTPLASWLPWHFDHAYNNELNRAGVLRAIEIPAEGGRTGFVDGIELYQALDPELREAISGRNVVYRMNVIMDNLRFGRPAGYRVLDEREHSIAVMKEAEGVPRAVHPAVWTRADGRPVLHVSPWMAEGIEGGEDDAGDALLHAVAEAIFAKAESLAYWHDWSTTDMLIWDNWRVLHAVSGHPAKYRRRMQRTTIRGDYGLGYFEGGASSDAKVLERTY
jgi:taurine dioxygenase